jgi:hypothetical protein
MIQILSLCDFSRIKGFSLILLRDYCALCAHEFRVAGADIGPFECRKA